MKAFLRELLVIVVVAIIVFFLLQTTIQKASVNGYSMEPSFQDEQQLLINKVVYYLHEPERGDVIILHPPAPPYSPDEAPFIKRIIALPSDIVEITQRTVYVNGIKLDEPYIKEPPYYNLPQQEIHENEYFVLGDNRNITSDSHNGWTVPRQNIIGKAWLSIWPPGEWGLVPNYALNEQVEGSGGK
ncbi:signal peptidase I [Chloroflexota bacterium]